jgi:ABC-2 type transport system ATP-binding protein
MKAIETKDLVKRYEDIEAVKGITLDIEEGELFGLLGPNGAGKTTTISARLRGRRAAQQRSWATMSRQIPTPYVNKSESCSRSRVSMRL